MTEHGEKLSEITPEAVIERLADESDGKAVKRLVAAREYLSGRSPAAIAEKYGWPEQTIYSWLDRLESDGLDDGLHDDPPSGRPPTLRDEEFRGFQIAVRNSPADVGFAASEWSSATAQRFLQERFGYDLSRRHVRRLLNRARRS